MQLNQIWWITLFFSLDSSFANPILLTEKTGQPATIKLEIETLMTQPEIGKEKKVLIGDCCGVDDIKKNFQRKQVDSISETSKRNCCGAKGDQVSGEVEKKDPVNCCGIEKKLKSEGSEIMKRKCCGVEDDQVSAEVEKVNPVECCGIDKNIKRDDSEIMKRNCCGVKDDEVSEEVGKVNQDECCGIESTKKMEDSQVEKRNCCGAGADFSKGVILRRSMGEVNDDPISDK